MEIWTIALLGLTAFLIVLSYMRGREVGEAQAYKDMWELERRFIEGVQADPGYDE